MQSIRFFLCLCLLSLAMPVLASVEPSGQDSDNQTLPAANAAHVRVAYFSPDGSSIDVYIDGSPSEIRDLTYPSVSAWVALPAGAHDVSIVPAGASISEALVGPIPLSLQAQTWSTIAVFGSEENDTLTSQVFQQDMSELVPGVSRVLLINGLVDGPSINLLRDGVPYYTTLDFGELASVDMDSGTYDFAAATGSGNVLAEIADIELIESYYYLLALVGNLESGETQFFVSSTDRAVIEMGLGELAPPGTVIEAIASSSLAGDLGAAFEEAGLATRLRDDGPYTVFAPAEFAQSSINDLSPQDLANVLAYHVVEGELMSQQILEAGTLTTLQGGNLDIRVEGDNIFVNDRQAIAVNVPATNGVVHILNGVLTPPASSVTAPPPNEATVEPTAEATAAG